MKNLSKSWSIPLLITGVVLLLITAPGILGSIVLIIGRKMEPESFAAGTSIGQALTQLALEIIVFAVGIWSIKVGRALRLSTSATGDPTDSARDMFTNRRIQFYTIIAVIYPIFFLLHWNGMFSFTYYWFLKIVNGTNSFGPQISAAFVSSLLIFGIIIALFEAVNRMDRRKTAVKNN